ncbi:MAG TPA: recombinase A [Polyangiaceae bacterium]|nr:recombinase A [Polyangiaceae bacterium]
MALPAALAHLSPRLVKAGAAEEEATGPNSDALPFGFEALDQVLPDHGLLRGGVVELALHAPGGLSTTLGLAAVRAFQRHGAPSFGASLTPWCAFVDPSATLYAPGVAASGVALERLLVVRPTLEALGRVAVKLAESNVFELVVIDTVGTLGQSLDYSLGRFGRIVRRLSMAVDGTRQSVLLLTDAREPRALPLPVAQRIEIARPTVDRLSVRVAKDRRGRISGPRPVAWARGAASLPETEHVRKLA